ncbi:hypothetical protein ACIBD9_17875 [Micromonospora sp. NPDC050784]|uniref:hypothetical protein n=1 Tax=Micromonospora sp. NPDC050784 TaxID=3364281 RepID=UPI00379C797F
MLAGDQERERSLSICGLTVPVTSFGVALRVAESWTLADGVLLAVATSDYPDRVVARPTTPVGAPGRAIGGDGK